MMFEAGRLTIFVPKLSKQSRPGHHLEPMVLLRYPGREICVVSHLEEYIEKTKDLWKDQNLLISFVKSHKCITISAISRWCITVLKNTGVDITVFGSHSTNRSSRPGVFLRKGVLKVCSKFTIEHSCRSAISIKLQSNFIEITLRHGCSPVNLLHIFRTPFLKNSSGRPLLNQVSIDITLQKEETFHEINK